MKPSSALKHPQNIAKALENPGYIVFLILNTLNTTILTECPKNTHQILIYTKGSRKKIFASKGVTLSKVFQRFHVNASI